MSTTLLRVDSSPRTDSVTRSLTAAFTDAWSAANPDGRVIHHDLATLALPHLGAAELGAWYVPTEDQSDLHAAVLARSERLIDDLLAADEIVIGAPMWNFGIPSSLKAWIDHVIRAGRTVSIGPDGYAGLVTAARAVVVTARGSDFRPGSPAAALDFQAPYLQQVLSFLGVGHVELVTADHQGPNWSDGTEVVAEALRTLTELV